MTKRFWKSGAAGNLRKIGFAQALVISLVACGVSILAGCLVPSQEAVKKPSWPAQQPQTSESGDKTARTSVGKAVHSA